MTIAAVRAAIGTALTTITSIASVNDQVPDVIPKLPATIASLERIIYHRTLEGCIVQSWRILLLLREGDSQSSHDDLDPYLAVSGSDSVKAVLEAASIGDGATVSVAENIGFIGYRQRTYVGAEFLVEVPETA